VPTAINLPHVLAIRKQHPSQVCQAEAQSLRAEQVHRNVADGVVCVVGGLGEAKSISPVDRLVIQTLTDVVGTNRSPKVLHSPQGRSNWKHQPQLSASPKGPIPIEVTVVQIDQPANVVEP
jgi:hypothetical protein